MTYEIVEFEFKIDLLFSPRSKHDVEMRPGRGQQERRERMDRDKLKDLLFERFEEHQVISNPTVQWVSL